MRGADGQITVSAVAAVYQARLNLSVRWGIIRQLHLGAGGLTGPAGGARVARAPVLRMRSFAVRLDQDAQKEAARTGFCDYREGEAAGGTMFWTDDDRELLENVSERLRTQLAGERSQRKRARLVWCSPS
jgi:hypothetical protein